MKKKLTALAAFAIAVVPRAAYADTTDSSEVVLTQEISKIDKSEIAKLPEVIPKTGDVSDVYLWIGIALIVLALCGIVLLFRKAKRKGE